MRMSEKGSKKNVKDRGLNIGFSVRAYVSEAVKFRVLGDL